MSFLSPIWLAELVPWALLAGRLLRRRAVRVGVPFLPMWPRGNAAVWGGRRRVSAFTLTLLGGLLAVILAAGGLGVSERLTQMRVVVDRACDRNELVAAVDRLDHMFRQDRVSSVTVVLVPGEPREVEIGQWKRVAEGSVAVALSNRVAVAEAADEASVVLSPVDPGRGRWVVVRPARRPGIVSLSASPNQVMVRLRGGESPGEVRLRISSDGVQKIVSVAASDGKVDDVFVDFDRIGKTVTAEVVGAPPEDPFASAYLVAGRSATVVVDNDVASAERRWAAAFNGGGGTGAPVEVHVGRPRGQASGMWVQEGASDSGATQVVPHEVTEGIATWSSSAAATPPGFSSVVSRSGRTVVAVRDGPNRQLFFCDDGGAWAKTIDYVLFMRAAVRWVGRIEGPPFSSETPRSLGPGWTCIVGGNGGGAGEWPGIYTYGEKTVAVNTVDERPEDSLPPPLTLPAATGRGATFSSISPELLCCCLTFFLIAGFLTGGGKIAINVSPE